MLSAITLGFTDAVFPAFLGLSVLGLAISLYIYYTQRTGKKLVCLIGDKCDIVTKSRYSKTYGVNNALLGVLYYGALLAIIVFGIPVHVLLILPISALASAFSIYLVYVQFFVLRELCDYCMLSALINWTQTILLGGVAAGMLFS